MSRLSAEAQLYVGKIDRKIEPPSGFTFEEKAVWQEVADSKPADWFTKDTIILLETYCRAVIRIRWLEAQMKKLGKAVQSAADDDDLKIAMNHYDKVVKWWDVTSRNLQSLATKMRLTQQARTDSRVAANASRKIPVAAKQPWVVEDLDCDVLDDILGEA